MQVHFTLYTVDNILPTTFAYVYITKQKRGAALPPPPISILYNNLSARQILYLEKIREKS